MTLTIFAINLVPFSAYIASRNGRGCYPVALNRLRDGAALKRAGSGIFNGQRRQPAVMHRCVIVVVIENIEEFAASSCHLFVIAKPGSDDVLAFGQ